jgi:predicted GNAT family N-acyltransferase
MSAPRFTTRIVTWRDSEPELRAVRGAVFVREQGIPAALEWDAEDAHAVHALVMDPDHQPIATGRLLIQDTQARIGRMAVLPAWRGRGVGTEVLRCLLDEARRHGVHKVVLHAQTTAVSFYERFSFVREGDEYLEAGIPHYRMTLTLD